MIRIILCLTATHILAFCAGAIHAYLDCGKEVEKRIADGRLVERV